MTFYNLLFSTLAINRPMALTVICNCIIMYSFVAYIPSGIESLDSRGLVWLAHHRA